MINVRESQTMPVLPPPTLTKAQQEGLRARFGVSLAKLAEPTPAEMAVNFSVALSRWLAAGVPVVTEPVYSARVSVCQACSLWDGKARLGLGKCNAPGCGCTRFKRWLLTERCPLKKWPA